MELPAWIPPRVAALVNNRLGGQPSWVIFVVLFLGLGWIRAAVEKIISTTWWSGQPILDFAAVHAESTLPWYSPIIEHIIAPSVKIVAFATVTLQVLIGLSLITGYLLRVGLVLAIALNLNIIVAGGVDPSIFYLLLQGAVALWLLENTLPVPLAMKQLRAVMAGAMVLLIFSIPFVGTLHPKDVIGDPGAVLATFGLCVLVGSLVAMRNRLATTAMVTRSTRC